MGCVTDKVRAAGFECVQLCSSFLEAATGVAVGVSIKRIGFDG